MGRIIRRVAVLGAAVVAVVAAVPAGAATDGMLTKKDVRLPVLSKPHSATVIVYDNVVAGSCEQAETVERDATVASFGTKKGAALNELVYAFGSEAEAATFFDDARTADQNRADCGTTANATIASIAETPKGVGDDRYTVVSTEDVGGVTRDAQSVVVRSGDRVVGISFLDWTAKQPSTKKVVKRALARLG